MPRKLSKECHDELVLAFKNHLGRMRRDLIPSPEQIREFLNALDECRPYRLVTLEEIGTSKKEVEFYKKMLKRRG